MPQRPRVVSLELVGVHAAAAEDGVLGELHHLLGDHASRRLELPPLAVLELHEARHEGLQAKRSLTGLVLRLQVR